MRRFLLVLRAAWHLLRHDTPLVEQEPPVQAFSGFDFKNNSYLHELVRDGTFLRMVTGLGEDSASQLMTYLRTCIKSQNQHEAAQTEAAMTVFDDLPSIFLKYAAMYRAPRP